MKKHLFTFVTLLLLCSSCATDAPKEITMDYFISDLAEKTAILKAEIINQKEALIYTNTPEKVYAIPLKNAADVRRIQEYLMLNGITIDSNQQSNPMFPLSIASIVLVFITPLLYIVYALVLFFVLKNIVRKEFQPETDKLVWVIIVLFVPFIGFILYYLYGRKAIK